LIEDVRKKKGFGSSKITKEGVREKDTCTPGDKQVASKKLDWLGMRNKCQKSKGREGHV
jgi:hypothetical protein